MDENGEHVTTENSDGEHEMRIEKKVTKTIENGEENVDVQIDVDGMIEGLNIDSLIEAAMLEGGDSNHVFVKKVIIMDEQMEGDSTFTWTEMNTDGADFHHSSGGHNHHMEVAVWGEDEDFTLLIVSYPENGGNKTADVKNQKNESGIKLFPNPTSDAFQLQLNFKDKAATVITISDIKGKVVAKIDLGTFKGQFNEDIDVSSWSKGVYIVQVEHGTEKTMEKLIVQ
jgi:hypothetical protein